MHKVKCFTASSYRFSLKARLPFAFSSCDIRFCSSSSADIPKAFDIASALRLTAGVSCDPRPLLAALATSSSSPYFESFSVSCENSSRCWATSCLVPSRWACCWRNFGSCRWYVTPDPGLPPPASPPPVPPPPPPCPPRNSPPKSRCPPLQPPPYWSS